MGMNLFVRNVRAVLNGKPVLIVKKGTAITIAEKIVVIA
jgi:hypothetical protein